MYGAPYGVTMMDVANVATILKELGHATRLKIYKRLVKAGEQGLPVGVLQKELNVPASTLSHHMAALVSVGLVVQTREGRTLYCTAQYTVLENILQFLLEECCVEQKGEIRPLQVVAKKG